MRAAIRTFMMAIVLAFTQIPDASAITIITNFIGGSSPANAVGGGSLVDIFNTAAEIWESAIKDTSTVYLSFGWEPLNSAGSHTLIEQGGSPNREIVGIILFDNSGNAPFYMDPTPDLNEEYLRITAEYQDLGGGYINVALVFSYPVGDALGHIDLLSVALHEIGHALGMSHANISFVEETMEGAIRIGDGLPFAGTIVPLSFNNAGVTSHFDPNQVIYGSLMAGVCGDERRIPSSLDILANAQVSGYTFINLNLQQMPESVLSLSSGSDNGNLRRVQGRAPVLSTREQ